MACRDYSYVSLFIKVAMGYYSVHFYWFIFQLTFQFVPCEGGIPAFDIKEIHKYLKKIDGWDVIQDKEKNYSIEKKFKFGNYVESEKFVLSVGKIAESEGHHPDISFGWGYAKVKISTHSIKGLAESDFVLAAKIDKI